MSAPRLSEFTKREIVKAYGRGTPISAIAMRYGVDQSYPAVLAKRRAVQRMETPEPNRAKTPKLKPLAKALTIVQQARVLDLHAAGNGIEEIAAHMHCTLPAAAHGLAEAVERERYEAAVGDLP